MQLKSLLLAFVGLGLAAGSVIGAQRFMEPGAFTSGAAEAEELAEIVVAKQEIGFGIVIEPYMLTTQRWPADAVPPQAFTGIEQLTGGDEPRRAKRAMTQGELVLTSKVSAPGEKVTIVQTLGSNMRAMAIKVDAVTGVGGFVTPGDKVDVVLTQGRDASLKAVTILQNIRVVGIDQTTDEDTSNPAVVRTITVEVTAEQGQKLALAQAAGNLSLTLRTLDGVADEPMRQVRLQDILLDRSPSQDPEPRLPVITVNRGGNQSTVELIRRTN